MSPTEHSDAGSARQQQKFQNLKSKGRKPPAPPDEDEIDSNFEPLDCNRLYTPKTLQQSLRVGRLIYEGLLSEGMPCTHIKGRYFFSGRLVIEFMEKRTSTHGKAAKGPKG